MQRLNHIVLVHGASHGAFCWDYVAPLLRDMGYRVSVPDLPGLGNDQTPVNTITMQSYIDRTVATVKAAGEAVLLVGHSMGGAVICGATEAIPDQVGKMLPVAGLMLADGDSMDGAIRQYMPDLPQPKSEGVMDFDPAQAGAMFYNTCTPEMAQWSLARLRPQAAAPFKGQLRLTPARYGKVPKTYIVCAQDQALPPAMQLWLCERTPGVKTREMDCDHSPFYCDPKGLAAILTKKRGSDATRNTAIRREGGSMIKVYYAETPNVFKVTIAIAEMGLESERVNIDLMNGEQLKPEFLAINPNNRVPAITDMKPADGGKPLHVFESGAILLYLAEKTGKFLPKDPRGKADAMQWVFWQMANQGPMIGQFGHFRNYAPEKLAYAITRFGNEATRVYRVLDQHLKDRAYIAGEYSIADMACWPWIIFRPHHGLSLDDYPNLRRWYEAIDARPAVKEALKGWSLPAPIQITGEVRKIMFNQK